MLTNKTVRLRMGGLAGRVSLDLLCALPSSLARTRRLAHSERRSRASGRSSHLESAGRRSPVPLFLSASRPRVEPVSCSIRHVPAAPSRFRCLGMTASSEDRLLRGPPPQRASSSAPASSSSSAAPPTLVVVLLLGAVLEAELLEVDGGVKTISQLSHSST